MSHQMEIKYMLATLRNMNQQLGGDKAKKIMADSEFDFIQEEFLTLRHQIQKMQDERQREGLTTKTAGLPYKIREGVNKLEDLLQKLKKEYERLAKKKKDTAEILSKKKKIVDNCEQLFSDIVDRAQGETNPKSYQQTQTLTDMKSKLLHQIEVVNDDIHGHAGSEDKFSLDDEQIEAIEQFDQKDKEQDLIVDDIILNLRNVRQKAKNINEKQDEVNQKIASQNKQAAKLQKRLKTDNDKLKVVIEKMSPNRCCLAIFLLLLLIGLVVVIIKFVV